jgi:hypothetical protein
MIEFFLYWLIIYSYCSSIASKSEDSVAWWR